MFHADIRTEGQNEAVTLSILVYERVLLALNK